MRVDDDASRYPKHAHTSTRVVDVAPSEGRERPIERTRVRVPVVMSIASVSRASATAVRARAVSRRGDGRASVPGGRAARASVAGVARGTRRVGRSSVVVVAASGDANEPVRAPALTDDVEETTTGTTPTPTPRGVKLPPGPLPRPPLRVAAGLAAFGALESTYLAVQKLTGGEVACPVGGCQTALNSGYAELFGAPLSAYGAVAYGLVAALSFWGSNMQAELVAQGDANRDETLEASYARSRLLLFFASTGLAGVSSYLLYVLAVKLGGVECVYCLTSATLSLTLFGIGFAGLSSKESGNTLPAAIALYVVTVLTMSIVLTESPEASSSQGLRLEYAPPQLEQSSTAYSRALAKHLAETGAKMYGAFWCSHCIEQKETFGAGAEIPYVECFPDGWERGTPLSGACEAAKVDGFPTWVINGKKLEGEQTLEKLAELSGFEGQNDAASMVAELF